MLTNGQLIRDLLIVWAIVQVLRGFGNGLVLIARSVYKAVTKKEGQ
jgi:hypothetical protein